MDRTSVIVIVVCVVLIVGWMAVRDRIFPPMPAPPAPTNAPVASVTGTNAAPVTATTPSAPQAPSSPRPALNTNLPETLLEVTNSNAHYTFTSRGGGLKLVELLHYPETVSRRRSQQQTNRVATLNNFAPVPALAILGGDEVQGDSVYNLTQTTAGVRAEKTLTNGLRIVKDFTLSTNYLLFATVSFENTSGQPLTLPAQEWVAGTATPMNVQDDGSAVGVTWYDGSRVQDVVGASYFSSRGFGGCVPRVPPSEYRGGSNDVVWVAPHNQFFAFAVMPLSATNQAGPAAQLVVRKVDLPRPSEEEITYRTVREPAGYEAVMAYPAIVLTPHQTARRELAIFAGPKEYRTLATDAASLNNNIDAIMGFGTSGFSAFFGFFSKFLLLSMNWLHNTFGLPYGWAIVAITIIIKAIFWPLTQVTTRSAKRMQVLQPQIKALQEKYKDDPVKAQRKMMEFWKEHKINPMSGCLPTLIQMPVFIGFFYMIRSAIELRGASFLWVADLSKPDTIFIIPGVNFPFNLLPLIMGATMLWQAHLTPPSPGMDPAQAKMMRYMPLIFMVFLYNFSAGLTLYWTVQNLLSILQAKLIKMMPEVTTAPSGPVLTGPPKRRK
jgi:YidC/Oxa1 family membrane protein insertase